MRMIRKQALSALLLVALLAPGGASAQWYFGVTAGQTNNEWASVGSSGDKDTSTFGKVFAGHELSPQFAVEIGYADLGKIVDFSSPTASVDAKSAAISLVGKAAASPQIDMFARLGVGAWNAKWTLGSESGTKTGAGTVVGLGVNLRFASLPKLSLGFEWEQYQNVGEGAMAGSTRLMGQNVDTLGIRLVYHLDLLPGP